MRVWVHRGQAALLLVVGILLGAAVAGATAGHVGLPEPVATRTADVFMPQRTHLPARIEIGSQTAPERAGGAKAVRPAPHEPPAQDRPGAPPAPVVPGRPPTATVVPPAVYAYPADDHGGADRSGSDGGNRGHR